MFPALVSRSPWVPVFVAAFLSIASVASGAWSLTSVEDTRSALISSARFDPAGMPAIAFGTNVLVYAAWNGGDWVLQVVDRGCGGDLGPSLAFDPGGNPAISYHDDAGALKLARWNGVAWALETVDSAVTVAGATSLAFELAGTPSIAYFDQTNHDLRYAAFDGTAWTVATLDGAAAQVGEYPSLAFGADRQPAVSYFDRDNRDLKLARFDGAAWQLEVVDGALDAGEFSSLAFDANGDPGISYGEGLAVDIKYAHWNGTGWDVEYAVTAGGPSGTSLGFDGTGSAAIAYFDNRGVFNARVRYAVRGPAGWTSQEADPQFDSGAYPSLAFDQRGDPGISYLDHEHGTLKFTRWNGTAFVPEHVDGGGPFSGGSVAFDAAGNPAVSYWGGTLAGLKLARFDGVSWTAEAVDPGLWRGTASSLRFDAASHPLIAYDDRFLGLVKLARFDGSIWTLETVAGPWIDPTAPVAPSLALDPAGNPAIGYRENAFSLQLARWNGSIWTFHPVGGSDLTFDASRSLAFDPAGNPALVFFNIPGPVTLRFALWNGTGFDNEVITTGNATGYSLAFDGSGQAVAAYSAGGEVRVARRVGVTWQSQVIAAGSTGTLAIDPAGNPALSYLDSSTQQLKLARWDGTQWTTETIAAAAAAGALAIAGNGDVAVGYTSAQPCRAPEVALNVAAPPQTQLHRGLVAALGPGWQALALPLTSLNDDETPPFPAPVTLPGGFTDNAVPQVPLVLYRVLRAGSVEVGNSMRAVKGAGGTVALFF